ncbi:DNA-binding response OmpR family regulator [Clostridium algifaecis]|uniref:Stage 0 sporulation protein A homolog n=1 Tax=Clostridium algifaecis TaxID=1472040 RepID=A0ABS4KN92_9CLOT|nr:DNA-binding response OmpR family regulator [Clostridium algifaecis]
MKESILIIDDDKDIREMIVNYFSKEGYVMQAACNGEDGLQIVKSKPISLILLDVMMPKMDGYTMIIRLREFSSIPVILLTAKDQQIDKIKGFIDGCDDYMII